MGISPIEVRLENRVRSHRGSQFLIINQYFDFTELQARGRKPMYMADLEIETTYLFNTQRKG